jgi:hypothetical protein
VRRLHGLQPEARILLCCWDEPDADGRIQETLTDTGELGYATTLYGAIADVLKMVPAAPSLETTASG